MRRFKRCLTLWVPGLVLLGGLGTWAARFGFTAAVAQEEPHKPPEEDPTSPADYLWQPAKPELIKDEPLQVAVPKGLQPLFPKLVVPAVEPDDQGQVRAGQAALLRPADLARRHGQLRHLPQPGEGLDRRRARCRSASTARSAAGAPRRSSTRSTARRCSGTAARPRSKARRRGRIGTRSRWASSRTRRSSSGSGRSRATASSSRRSSAPTSPSTAWPRRSPPSSGWPPSRATRATTSTTRGDLKALSESEKRGMVLFGLRLSTDDEFKTERRAPEGQVHLCHVGVNFTDEQFHNLGVGWDEKTKKFADLGRWAPVPIGAKTDAELGAFKTPTVRDVARTGPLHARRQPQDAGRGRRALRQGGQPESRARQGHEEAEPDRRRRRPTSSPS